MTPDGEKRLWLCRSCHLAHKPGALLILNGNDHIANHLKGKHSILVGEFKTGEQKAKLSNPLRAATQNPHALSSQPNRQPFWAKGYIQAYVDWTILQDVTFRQATRAHTRALLTFDRPQIQDCLVSAPTSLSNWIKNAFAYRTVNIKYLLVTALSKINISCDIWTSTNGLSLLGVVAHFIDKDGKLRSVLIGLPRIRGSHTGENIARCLTSVILKYEIKLILGCLTIDNATNNDELYAQLEETLIRPNKGRLRCNGHIINLIVKALIYGEGVSKFERELIGASDQAVFEQFCKKGFVGKLHNIVKYIMRTPGRREDFAEY